MSHFVNYNNNVNVLMLNGVIDYLISYVILAVLAQQRNEVFQEQKK